MSSYQKLLAYQACVRFGQVAEPLVAKITRHSQSHARQFARAVDSMEDNSAEGGTATTPGRKANFYRIARDSGGECMAQLRRALRKEWIARDEWTRAQLALNEAMFLLEKLIARWERVAGT